MTNWADLHDAYGTAESIPSVLEEAEQSADDFGDAWDEAWGRLCHQGSVYSASYAAIPLLESICSRHPARGYLPALQLAGAILASADGPEDSPIIRNRHRAEIERLRQLAEGCLPLAADDTEFIYALEALMAFEDGDVWQRDLNYLADGLAPLDCSACGENLELNIDEIPATLNLFDSESNPSPVTPKTADLSALESRLLDLAATHGRHTVRAKLTYAFGQSPCPSCGATLVIPRALS